MPDQPGIAARVFRALADAGVNIDMIVQNVSADGHTDISFTLPKTDLAVAEPILERLAERGRGAAASRTNPDIAKVSLIGAGMKSHPGVAADMFDALGDAGINIEIISTSSIRISCVVPAADVERAVQAVHEHVPGSSSKREPMAEPRIGVVGATGAVGTITLRLLAERGYDERARLRVGALGRHDACRRHSSSRRRRTRRSAAGDVDLCLFSVGTGASRELVPLAVRGGAICVDKSSAYRLDDGIPLVVPEVNGDRARSSTTASSPTRTAARSRSPAC